MNYVLLIVGFILLIKGANYFVESATWIANKFNIPRIIVGMTIVAIGTSLPEIIISCTASYNGEGGMAIGNILGSNIINICIVLGIVSIISPISVKKNTLLVELPMLFISEVLLLIFGYMNNKLDMIDGVILIIIFICFMLYIIKSSKNNEYKENNVEEDCDLLVFQAVLYLIGGSIAIKYGGDLIVDSASRIALNIGISHNLIGLTIVAIGTSLPEAITSIVAAKNGETDLAFGNIIGSNLFNILLALSTASIIRPLLFTKENIIDCIAVIILTIITFIFARISKKIVRYEGIILICLYASYFTYILLR